MMRVSRVIHVNKIGTVKKGAHFMRDVDFRNALKLAALFFFSLSGEGSLRRMEDLYRTPYGVSIRIS